LTAIRDRERERERQRGHPVASKIVMVTLYTFEHLVMNPTRASTRRTD